MQETQETWVESLGWEDHLEKEMATHSSIPGWGIPWIEEPWRPQLMGCKESDATECPQVHDVPIIIMCKVLAFQCVINKIVNETFTLCYTKS